MSSLVIIRVPFFLLFGSNKEPLKQKGQKGTTQNLRSEGFGTRAVGVNARRTCSW